MKRSLLYACTLFVIGMLCAVPLSAEVRPNILWITSEDNGPHLGAYGDTYADTPHLDELAERGMIYLYAWSTAPVCAPARTAIITGVYPQSTGSQHMRSMLLLPEQMKMYPQLLREAGYYCTNNQKEDFNLQKPGTVWDESSNQAHWRNREEDQPFFAIFNFTISHESQIRTRPHQLQRDPDQAPVPSYHPDTPEVRHDWAQYYDKVTAMDRQAGAVLEELADDRLAEDTIIFYYGDHGSGMPRSKRWPYNSGLHVPLIVYFPEKWQHLAPQDYQAGGSSERLVGFVDLAPTLLSLVGIEPPPWMQGEAFAGPYETPPPKFMHGFRGRMDERYDMVRSLRDQRYIYIRNYMPHKIYGQYIDYMFQTPTTRIWRELYDAGELEPPQSYFWERKPPEELYDLQRDPDEVDNLADCPEHQEILQRMRAAQQALCLEIRDLGFLPEAEIHTRAENTTPYEMARDSEQYPLERVMKAAEVASSMEEGVEGRLAKWLEDDDSAVRYWAALGLLMRGEPAVKAARPLLRERLIEDDAPNVRIVAAEALGKYGDDGDLQPSLDVLIELARLDEQGVFVAMYALNAIEELGEKARPLKQQIAELPRQHDTVHGRMRTYVPRLIERLLAELGG